MEQQHRVVIIGGGFAGLSAAKALKRAPVSVTLIDRRNHHLFQPLLYQVATGGLSPADIATPIRAMLSKQKNARVILGEVDRVDVDARRVCLADGSLLDYDTLVVATGATHSYFGNAKLAQAAPGLKTLDDATRIRRSILRAFEVAERITAPEERRPWLTFVIVGGGPTGVELAGAIGELARITLKGNFRSFDPAEASILLFEGGPRVLAAFDPKSSEKAVDSLSSLGVTVQTSVRVENVDEDSVEIDEVGNRQRIPCKTVVWAAGVAASPLAEGIATSTGAHLDRAGRLVVEPDLTVPGHPELYVGGDLANYPHQTGVPLRGTADVAAAKGAYVGRAISRRLKGNRDKPFKFTDFGIMAVIGRSRAVAELPGIRLSGLLAWWTWLLIHLIKLVNFQNKLTVSVQWGYNYLTRNRSAMLITGDTKMEMLQPDDAQIDREETEREQAASKS